MYLRIALVASSPRISLLYYSKFSGNEKSANGLATIYFSGLSKNPRWDYFTSAKSFHFEGSETNTICLLGVTSFTIKSEYLCLKRA